MSFLEELKRRNVVKVGIAYAVSTWILLQLTDVVADILQLPDWAPKLILLILVIGFVPALIFAWAFEMTPEGIKREKDVERSASITPGTGRKLDYMIIGLLAVGMAYFVWESRFSEKEPAPNALEAGQHVTEAGDEDSKPILVEVDLKREKSIAVLPFTNRSPNPDDAYFTDGIHDDLLTQLAKIKAFSVISRTSVMEYRDTTKNLKQIALELGVANVMEGSVQRSGNRVRINVQLIDASTDEHLWAEIYDRQLTTENLFDIQSEIAKAIATALHATLTDSEIASVADVPTENVKAYELYLQGKRFDLGETAISFDTSVELYREALKLDSKFKLAWIGLAHAFINKFWGHGGDPADRDRAREAIDKAKAIDPDFPELNMAEGFYYYWGLRDYATALKHLDKAVDQMPGNAEAHMWKGWASRRAGLWEQAVDSMQIAIRLDPRTVINLIEYGQTLSFLGRYSEALAITEQAYAVDPGSYWVKSYLAILEILINGDTEYANTLMIGAQHTNDVSFVGYFLEMTIMARQFETALQFSQDWNPDWEIYLHGITLREHLLAEILMIMGRVAEAGEQAQKAIARLEEMKKQGSPDYRILGAELRSYAILGDRPKVLSLTDQYLSAKPADAVRDLIDNYSLARSYALAGMTDECVEILDKLLTAPSPTSVTWIELDPYFDGIREEPKFIAMLERHK